MGDYPFEELRQCCCDEAAFQRMLSLLPSWCDDGQHARDKALFRVVTKIRETLDVPTIFRTAASEVRQLLNADRVGVFRFDPTSSYDDGEFVSEDVVSGYTQALSVKLHDHCFGERYSLGYLQGQVQAVADIHTAGLRRCHRTMLEQFEIRANLVVPILRGEKLWGLFCINQCSGPREWQTTEIEFVQQVAVQLSIAIQQAELLDQTQQQAIELADALYTLRQIQTQCVQQEKMSSLGQLVAGVAHEINNPVNFIYGNLSHAHQYAETLLEVLALYQKEHPHPSRELRDRLREADLEFIRDDFAKMLASMQIGADRIRQLVLSLRHFSRIDEAGMKPVNIHEGLDSTLVILQNRLKPRTNTPGIQVIKDYGELPLVECYAGQLNQVFMNILCNAIDALEDNPAPSPPADSGSSSDLAAVRQVTIRTRLVQSSDIPHVLICIADNGPGIPEAVQTKLFEPFFTTKPGSKGTGLGLSISHQIITQRHGGDLYCISKPNEGTEFWIDIPAYQRHPEAHPANSVRPTEPERENTLPGSEFYPCTPS